MAAKKTSAPALRAASANASSAHAGLAKKLGVKPGSRLLVLGAPPSLDAAFDALPAEASRARSGKGPFNVVVAFARDSESLGKMQAKVIASLVDDGVLWIAFPKVGTELARDLSRDNGWASMHAAGWGGVGVVAIDATWSAKRLRWGGHAVRAAEARGKPDRYSAAKIAASSEPPAELIAAMKLNAAARATWDGAAPSHRKDYIEWIVSAKRAETRGSRIETAIAMLASGVRDRNAKYR